MTKGDSTLEQLMIGLVFFCSVINDLDGPKPDDEGTQRLDEALIIYRNNIINRVMVTGGCRNDIKLGEAYKKYLVSKGVRDCDIIMEDESSSTASNIEKSSAKLSLLTCSDSKIIAIYLISNFRHLRRINIVRRHNFWPWLSINTPIEPDEKVSTAWLELIKLVVTLIDPHEKSFLVQGFKKKRAQTTF